MTDTLADGDEVLFRQVHPSFIDEGHPSSQTFTPTPKDDGKLSVDRSSLTTAADSHALFVGDGNASDAVYGLTVAEFSREALACVSDPLEAAEKHSANPAHAYADYTAHKASAQKAKAKRLKLKAIARGQLHP